MSPYILGIEFKRSMLAAFRRNPLIIGQDLAVTDLADTDEFSAETQNNIT